MGSPLRILHLEDDPVDAELIQETLAASGIDCEIKQADTEAAFASLLTVAGFDLILADYTLPSFDGLSALKLARRALPLVPFIFVSGTLDEDVAIEALKIGATDYVFKTRLSRLAPSVQRSLREAAERSELVRAEQALRRSEAYLAQAQELSHTGSFGWDASGGDIYWSRETFRIFEIELGVRVTEAVAIQRVHPDDRPALFACMDSARRHHHSFEIEHRLLLPGGTIKHVKVVAHPSESESGAFKYVGAITDISRQKKDEAELQKALAEINQLKEQLYRENIALRDEVDKTSMFEEIVGESAALRAVLARVKKVAPTDSTVLVTGETGTGKELIARAIHKRSGRAARAFVAVNCAAIPSSLIGSELFGHEKGAFTGALQRRLGRFELAEGGTIFLDEIGELPAETQIALLRVLQEREFERIGGSHPIRADVRVITATNRDLEAEIVKGTFRRDLYYRLNVFPMEIPPLRERREDIPTLVEYFIHRYSMKAGKKIGSIDRKTLELLELYSWPGNIRELQNVIERSVIVYENDPFLVDPKWLAESVRTAAPREKDQEREIIEAALAASGGRVSGPSGAASQLGVPASTLESKIRSLKIDKYRFKSA